MKNPCLSVFIRGFKIHHLDNHAADAFLERLNFFWIVYLLLIFDQ